MPSTRPTIWLASRLAGWLVASQLAVFLNGFEGHNWTRPENFVSEVENGRQNILGNPEVKITLGILRNRSMGAPMAMGAPMLRGNP